MVAHVVAVGLVVGLVGPFQLKCSIPFHSKHWFSYKMVKCMFMHAQRTLHLQGSGFGASSLRNNEEQHGSEDCGQTVANLSCLPPPHSCPGRNVCLCAPRLAKNEFRVSVHHFSKGATGASITVTQSPLKHILAVSRSTYSTHKPWYLFIKPEMKYYK